MKEIIEEIEVVHDLEIENNKYSWIRYGGYVIRTNNQIIKIIIDNEQNCCENWGYIASEQDFKKFIGAEYHNIRKTDVSDINIGEFDRYLDEGDCIFIDVITSKGNLQFVVYNSHNGYYGHRVIVESKLLNIDEYI